LNREVAKVAKVAKKNALREDCVFPSPLRRENMSSRGTRRRFGLFSLGEKERSSFERLAFASFASSRSTERRLAPAQALWRVWRFVRSGE
jgi:hypothetical protein